MKIWTVTPNTDHSNPTPSVYTTLEEAQKAHMEWALAYDAYTDMDREVHQAAESGDYAAFLEAVSNSLETDERGMFGVDSCDMTEHEVEVPFAFRMINQE